MRIISFLAITLAVCLSVTTDAMPNTDHASAIVPEEELSLVEASNPEQKGIWDDCDTEAPSYDPNAPAPCQVSVEAAVVENLNPLKESQEGVAEESSYYPSEDQMKGLSDIAGTAMDLISATKQKGSDAIYGQGLQLISEVSALVPVEPFAGFVSLVAGIGATFFLSEDAPKPPPMNEENIKNAMTAALAEFELDKLEYKDMPDMMRSVMRRYEVLRTFQPNKGMCCLTNSTTCPAEIDACTTATSCTKKDTNPNSKAFGTSAKVGTEACCMFYEGKCEWIVPQEGPSSPIDVVNAKQLHHELTSGLSDICGDNEGSATLVLEELASAAFTEPDSFLQLVPKLQMFGVDPNGVPGGAGPDAPIWPKTWCNNCGYFGVFPSEYKGTQYEVGMWQIGCTQAKIEKVNALWKYWPEIKSNMQQWLLGYYSLLHYGSAVFQTISVNSKNQAFLEQFTGTEDSQGFDIFGVFHRDFAIKCGIEKSATVAKAMNKLLTFMKGPIPNQIIDDYSVHVAEPDENNKGWNVCNQEVPCDNQWWGIQGKIDGDGLWPQCSSKENGNAQTQPENNAPCGSQACKDVFDGVINAFK